MLGYVHLLPETRPALERRACECYGVVRREYDRLLSRTLPLRR